ncbi:MAG: SPOR domain-containing protein [Desulfobacteraceae bacterium]|nr:SPOR domain-containing protein [Desulfobacteraceae bacterium]
MISFKGILKYLIYIFIAAWMFLLGIMVGRGTSPVKFDTDKFQKRLEIIASEFGEKKDTQTQKKIDLKFYKVLDQPAAEEESSSRKKSMEIIPKKEKILTTDVIPLKISRKKLTLKKGTLKKGTNSKRSSVEIKGALKLKNKKSSEINVKSASLKKTKPAEQLTLKKSVKGRYTIQVAAYKDFKDAVAQMAILEKKGISSYREKGKKDGVNWYRIRIGSFATFGEARKFKEKLNKAKIKSMIIKKDTNEDIKR